MPVPYYGDFPTGHTGVVIPFNTFDSNDPSASVTIGEFANTDVHIHKNGSLTQRASASGVAIDIDVDAITGGHWVTIDLSDNTDAGFYAAGSEISVRIEGTTIDGATINAFIGAFSIERVGGALALLKAGTVKVDVETIKTRAVTCGAGVTIRADVGAAAAPGAANGMLIGGSNAATTFATLTVTDTTTLTGVVSLGSTLGITGTATLASLSVTGQLDAGNLLVDGTTVLTGTVGTGAVTFASVAVTGALSVGTTTTLTGNVSLGGTLGVVGTTTLAALSVTGQLDAGNVLVDTTTALTGAVTAPAGITADITGTISTVTNLTNLPAAGALEATLTAMKGATFNGATDSLEAIRNQGDSAWITATGFMPNTEDGSSFTALPAVTLANGAHGGAAASITLADYTDFQGASGLTAEQVRTEMDTNSAQLAAIVADTNELQINQGNWVTAVGFSTHSAADVKTAIEAGGSSIALIKAVTDALTSAAAAKLATSAGTIVSGEAAAGTLSTTQMTTNLTEATNDHYNGRIIIWTSGVLQNQATNITDYDGATKMLTYTAVTEAPTAADTFIIV